MKTNNEMTIKINGEEIAIDTNDVDIISSIRVIDPEFRIYSDGRFTLESGLNDGSDVVWYATADGCTIEALGFEYVLDEDGNETDEIVFTCSYSELEYTLNQWINN